MTWHHLIAAYVATTYVGGYFVFRPFGKGCGLDGLATAAWLVSPVSVPCILLPPGAADTVFLGALALAAGVFKAVTWPIRAVIRLFRKREAAAGPGGSDGPPTDRRTR